MPITNQKLNYKQNPKEKLYDRHYFDFIRIEEGKFNCYNNDFLL